MEFTEALEIVVAQTKHERYRELTAESHPSREHYRKLVIQLATGEQPKPEPHAYPPLIEQATSVITAAASFVASGFRLVNEAEVERRLTMCHGCDQFDTEQVRCRSCGCFANLKARAESEHCPIGKW
jgi:hypothetical protein